MPHSRVAGEDIIRLGQQIYEEKLRAVLEPDHIGEHLVIDVETGDYEVGTDQVVLSKRSHAKHPGGAFFGMRIGYRTSGTLGAWFQRSQKS